MIHAARILIAIMLLAGCVTPVPPAAPSAMVPAKLGAKLPPDASLYVEKVRLASATEQGKAPFDAAAGQFPLTQAEGLNNYQESIRLVLSSMGAKLPPAREDANYVLHTSILGGMAIPFMEAYSVLFVHYQLEDSKTGKIVWMKNVYSQARLEKHVPIAPSEMPDPSYARLAAANLRQMATDLAARFAADSRQIFRGE